jgi:hypothetical protein
MLFLLIKGILAGDCTGEILTENGFISQYGGFSIFNGTTDVFTVRRYDEDPEDIMMMSGWSSSLLSRFSNVRM